MRLRHIEVFNAVYTTGSISSAAKLLNVSQPSVSKVLRHAEDQLGFKLFYRAKNGLMATSEADLLFADAEGVFKQLTRLQRSAQNLRDRKTDHIRIVMITGLGFNITPLALARFSKRYPDVTVELLTEHYPALCAALLEHRADIGLVFQPPSHPSIKSMELGVGQCVCVYPNGEFPDAQDTLHLSDLVGHPFITMTEHGRLGAILKTAMQQQQVELTATYIAETGFVASNLVRCGLGVAIVDEFTAEAFGGNKHSCRPFSPPIEFTVNGLYPESHPLSEICLDFLKCFRAVFEEIQRKRADAPKGRRKYTID